MDKKRKEKEHNKFIDAKTFTKLINENTLSLKNSINVCDFGNEDDVNDELANKIKNNAANEGYHAELSPDKKKVQINDKNNFKMSVPARKHIGVRVINATTKHKKHVEHREATYKALVTNAAKILVKSQVETKIQQQRQDKKEEQKTEELLREQQKMFGDDPWYDKRKEMHPNKANMNEQNQTQIPINNNEYEKSQNSLYNNYSHNSVVSSYFSP